MPKAINVQISTADAELEFAIQPSTSGKQLFDQVTRTIGLRETWYFGLQYTDSQGLPGWLELKKKIQAQDVKKETPMRFRFRVKFYPEDCSEELIQDITRHMFYLQVRESVLSEEYYCPPETAVLLASYACQVKFGDYNPKIHKQGFLEKERLLSPKILNQHSLTKQQWEDRIVSWYSEHKGQSRDDTSLEYLKIVQDLEMYGINYFDITNKKGTQLLLGIDALGISIYGKEDRLTPKLGFPWSDIQHVSYSSKKFVIKPVEKTSPDFLFYVAKSRINKRILDLCMGNHELFIRRRKPDSIEVQQMKAQAKEERDAKLLGRMALQMEKQAREDAEKQQRELGERIRRYEEEMERSRRELERSREEALLLEQRMKDAEREREELEEAQRRAEEARREAEEAVHLEKAERELKEREAAEAQELLERKMEEAREREEETRRLQEELEEARREMEEKERALEEARQVQIVTVVKEVEMDLHQHQEHLHQHDDHHNKIIVVENGSDHSDDSDSDTEKDRESHDLLVEYEVIEPLRDDRVTQVEKDEKLSGQLKSLSAELSANKVEKHVTKNDLIHRKNVLEGRDKYKTLKQIRAGNTKSRVEVFESL